jgi:hypothetical protein
LHEFLLMISVLAVHLVQDSSSLSSFDKSELVQDFFTLLRLLCSYYFVFGGRGLQTQ